MTTGKTGCMTHNGQ